MTNLSDPRSPQGTEPSAVTATLPSMHAVLLQKLDLEARGSLMGYDRERRDLKVIDWPIGDDGKLLRPSEWDYYRRSFYFPSCLCPLFGGRDEQDVVVEREGVEYIARTPCAYESSASPESRMEGMPIIPPVPENAWVLLDRLQAMRKPGLTPEQFQSLLAQCPACEMIIARRMDKRRYIDQTERSIRGMVSSVTPSIASGSRPAAMARSRAARMRAFKEGNSLSRWTKVFSSQRFKAHSRTKALACVNSFSKSRLKCVSWTLTFTYFFDAYFL
ncbi:hypothetical protein BV25DRAFT_1983695 [Artomyces pyxidatus]|uniref:Uncharacterized protein n=1 Tax=Artomyces pyxidatus TaxID=48021 RepID=A0ACB8SI05_9AGAM|nr:hypothetical protein BV25DRAFT_1983695 [Artomyces pyxidatus]